MCLPLPPFFSLTIPKRQYKNDKNATQTSHKKFSEGKQAHVYRDGSLKNQPNLDGNDTTTLSHHPYILCHFANYTHHKNLYMHLAYPICKQGTQLCSLQSYTHKRLPVSAMFSSNKISQHNLNSNIPHRPSIGQALQFLHAVKTDYLPCSV